MRANSALPLVSRSRLVSLSLFYNFVVASGAMRLLINLMIHSGNALTATMTATFHPKRTETTNDRSARELSSVQGSGEGPERTEIFGQKDHAECVYAERDDFGDDHVNMPFSQERPLLNKDSVGEGQDVYQIVISSATMMSSLRINAVNEMATMFKNSFSNRTRAMIMIAAPEKGTKGWASFHFCEDENWGPTLVETDHEPDEERLVG